MSMSKKTLQNISKKVGKNFNAKFRMPVEETAPAAPAPVAPVAAPAPVAPVADNSTATQVINNGQAV